MTAQYVPLNNTAHKNLKVKQTLELAEFEKHHMLPLVVQEFMPAATSFPIIFAKNTDSGEYQPVAVTSLKPESNKFIKDGKWTQRYVPMQLRVAPFIAGPDETQEKLLIGINQNSTLLSEEEGVALFNEDGEQTEFLQDRVKFIGQLFDFRELTKQFVKTLTDHDLLQPKTLTVNGKDGEKANYDGIYMVDEKKLHELSDEAKLELFNKGALSAIYAHLASLNQIDLVMGE
ncbi:SapC family protein [Shewanella sp. FJAT-52076]|uniref:SapC family protein n=1 Tax=Shewanella sp. FJAT-52076 TaxID=2864202 RepID=UPI001C661CE9|nr:SapC family protein [Shewanella sp. FJAT-52076]QYJ76297.1 SapC family protein [Shewanella sp. FJAT-52076]